MTMDVHNSLLESLNAFDAFCRQHDIRYSLYGGTLLGAVREHGFIPWDDDADVIMTRDNYTKLLSALSSTDADYCIKGKVKKQFCKIEDDRFWVDIFICDYISEIGVFQKIKLLLLTALDIMYRDSESMKLSNLSQYSRLKQILYRIIYTVGQLFPKKWVAHCYTNVSEKWLQGKKELMFRSNDQYAGRALVFPAARMNEHIQVPFENLMLPVSNRYHDFLVQSYGENYLIPVQEDRITQVHNLVRSDQKIEL